MKVTLKNLSGKSPLLSELRDRGIEVSASCGGRHKCGKCRIIANGEEVLACSAYICGDAEVIIPGREEDKKSPYKGNGKKYNLAVDIGTTNVVAAILDGAEIVDIISAPNAQMSFGADVINRIQFCREGHLDELKRLICSQIDSFADYDKISVAGNTVMQSIFRGEDPSPVGIPPFEPSGLFENDEVLMPCISGYVGGDISAGLYASGAARAGGLWLYIDFGTNGEIALGNRNGFITCSCAAGPAFEMSGNLFGSEVVDETAGLLREGKIGRSGKLKGESVFSQDDIRSILLAKAAIRAGTELLLEASCKAASDITKLIIAGEFGKYINFESAKAIGLIPDIEEDKLERAGNASLKGAILALDDSKRREIQSFAKKCGYIELSSSARFNELFLKFLVFNN